MRSLCNLLVGALLLPSLFGGCHALADNPDDNPDDADADGSSPGLALERWSETDSTFDTTLRAVASQRTQFPTGPGGLQNQCGFVLVSLDGAADGFYDYGSHVTYVKSFELGGVLDGQLVITSPSGASGAYDLGPASPISVLLINPFEGGVDSYEATSGVVNISGDLAAGAGVFDFSDLTMELVGEGDAIGVSDCYGFFDFVLDGYSEVPASWTCASSAYSDKLCHCGCGAPDPSCGKSVRSCDECNAAGSCAERRRDCETIRENDPWTCEWGKPDDFLPNPKGKPTPLTWVDDIEPLFSSACGGCHPSFAPSDVTSYNVLISEGLVVPGSANASPLWTDRVNSAVPAEQMPPGGFGDDDKDLVRDWINEGALED